MKKEVSTFLSRSCWFLVLAVIGISCNDSFGPEINSNEKMSVSAKSNAEMLVAAQEVMDITGAGMVDQGITYGRFADNDDDHERYLCGAVVTKSVEIDNALAPDSLVITGSISIDFGDGTHCPDSADRRHSGKITTEFTIHVNLKKHLYSSVETVTLTNLERGSKTISGVFVAHAASGGIRTLDIINADFTYHGDDDEEGESGDDDDNEADSVTVTWTWNGSLTFSRDNGGTLDRDDDIKTITGSISATGDNGASFSSEITQAVTFKWECFQGRNIPVMGVVNVTNNGVLTTVDFGDGTCDKLYVATTNGTTTEHHF
jgi:hypothetical protein